MPGPFDGTWQFEFYKAEGFLRPDRPIRTITEDDGFFDLTFPLEDGDLTIRVQVQSSAASFEGSREGLPNRYKCVGHLVKSALVVDHIAGVLWRVRPDGDPGEVEDTGSFTAIKQGNMEPSGSQG